VLLVACGCAGAGAIISEQTDRLDRDFQTAVAQYNSGRFAEATVRLETLLRELPESFEVHELLARLKSDHALSESGKAETRFGSSENQLCCESGPQGKA